MYFANLKYLNNISLWETIFSDSIILKQKDRPAKSRAIYIFKASVMTTSFLTFRLSLA